MHDFRQMRIQLSLVMTENHVGWHRIKQMHLPRLADMHCENRGNFSNACATIKHRLAGARRKINATSFYEILAIAIDRLPKAICRNDICPSIFAYTMHQ